MKVYIAGPLFNESERALNKTLQILIKSNGFEVYLPQEDGGLAFTEIKQGSEALETRKRIFQHDVEEIRKCDIIICILDGRIPDEGTCVELGIAYALDKHCIGYKTDVRTMDEFGDCLMIEGCLKTICRNDQELISSLIKIK